MKTSWKRAQYFIVVVINVNLQIRKSKFPSHEINACMSPTKGHINQEQRRGLTDVHPDDISFSIQTVQEQQGQLTRTLVSK